MQGVKISYRQATIRHFCILDIPCKGTYLLEEEEKEEEEEEEEEQEEQRHEMEEEQEEENMSLRSGKFELSNRERWK